MPESSSWDVIFGARCGQVVLSVAFPDARRHDADFAELASRIGVGYRFLQTKPPTVRPGQRFSGAAYVGPWVEGIQQDRDPVLAVLGYGVGSVYAAAIAAGISRWQQAPKIILFDPQFASVRLLSLEFHREISAISSFLSDREIERIRNAAATISESASGDVGDVAAEMIEAYWKISSAAYERVGLGDARGNQIITSFESWMSWISVADQINPCRAWRSSTAIVSSDYAGLPNKKSVADCSSGLIGRRIPFNVGHANLLQSDSVAEAVLNLLESR